MPQISVIVPVYKVEPYLRRCVDSILAQTYRDFELILVDDGSPDGCPAICDEYAEQDSRVVVIHQQNGGLSSARNTGIDWMFANSHSQWLTFIDSDDWVHPEYLERLLNAATEYDAAISICGFAQTAGEEPEITTEAMKPVLRKTEEFFVNHNVNATIACGKLYRRDCFAAVRYPLGKLHEDEFTTYKILFQHKEVAVLSAPMYYYFYNEEGIMRSRWTVRRMDVLEAYSERTEFFRKQANTQLLELTLKDYTWRILLMMKRVAELEDQTLVKKYVSVLLNCLRRILIRYRRYFSVRKYPWAYEKAFPTCMKVFWLWDALRNKLTR